MIPLKLKIVWACMAWAGVTMIASAAASAAGEVHVVMSADTEGHVQPCSHCPDGVGLGGLARRATALAKLREAGPLLLVDSGNFLFGEDSVASGGKIMVAGYEALGYDAVNVSYRDLRLGKAATLSLLKDSKLGPVSANLLDEATGQPMFPAYRVKEVGGKKVAILGVCEPPAGMDFLPHLKQQLAGVKIQPTGEAVAQWLPKARAEAQQVVLLYYGTAAGLAPIREKFGKDLTAIFVGGVRPEYLPTTAGTAVIGAGEHGKQLAQTTVGAEAGAVKSDQVSVEPSLASDAAVTKVLAPFVQPTTPPATLPAPVAAAAPSLPATLEPGKTYPLGLTASNRGVRLTLANAAVLGTYGETDAGPGRAMLVLASEWENIIPLTLIKERQVPTAYKIPNLADHLYLVVDGSRVARLHQGGAPLAGHVPVKNFTLERLGETVHGNLVFDLPPGPPPHAMEIRFYDFAHGHMPISLTADVAAAATAEKPVSPPLKNQVLEAGLYSVRKSADLGAAKAPAGLTFLTIDLRARSTMFTEGDASVYDPKAAKGAKMKIGTVADWKESRKYAQLVADGEYAYPPIEASDLPAEPRFLPDVFTGGTLVFLVPEKYASLELRCDFPNAALPDGRLIRPEGLTIPLEGKRPALPARKAIASTRDQIFEMTVVGQSVATEFAGAKAADNHKFLVLDVTVKNLGGQHQEFFQPREQLKYATEAGQQLKMDDATLKGPQPPAEAVYIPAGDRRTFQVAYQIPAEDSRPRLSYASVTEGMSKVLPLSPVEKSVAVARPIPTPGAPDQPPPAPVKPEPPMKTVARADPPQPGVSIPGDKPIKALRVAAKQDRKPLGIAGVGLTADQVNTAIDTGAAALWELLKSDELKKDNDLNTRHEDVLVALALVHCGFHKKSPEFDAALRRFLESAKPREMGTYRAGLLAMLIEGYGDSQYVPKMRDAARYLLEGEGPDGTWGYTPNVPPEIFEKINTKHGVLRVEGGTPIGKPAEPWVRLTKPQVPDGDNSVTQYALLGLSTASRSGMKMPADVWKAALATATARQGTDGGWGYSTNGGRSYGSMSAAGICAVAIARYELGEAEPLKDETLERGIAWLANNFHVNLHPGNEGEWYYYYMYSIERVGRILDTEFIGEHEWYPVGARTLVSKQDADHLWKAPQGQERDPRLASSFALLFLTRATPSLIAGPEKRGGSGALIATATPPANRLYMILDASGSMLDNMDGQLKFDAARNAVWALVKDLPEKSDVALRVYGHRKRATDKGADQDTELLIPMGPLNKDAFHGKLDALRSRGKTPLALSLEQALADIRNGDPKHPVTVVLLTDGGEDTVPPRNPVKTAALLKDRKDIRFHIIGFDINQEEWSRQLQAMGTASGGDYWPAVKAADLERSLKVAVLATPESFEVLDAAGHVVAGGAFGEKVNLHEGQYTFRTNLAGRAFSQDVWVNTDGTTSVDFNGEEALASLATAPASAPPAPGPAVTENPPSPRPATPTPSARKFCTHCGGPLKPGQKFCPSCGMAVEK